jgi:hypothetical protein
MDYKPSILSNIYKYLNNRDNMLLENIEFINIINYINDSANVSICKKSLYLYLIQKIKINNKFKKSDEYITSIIIEEILPTFKNDVILKLLPIFGLFIKNIELVKQWFLRNIKLYYGLEYLCWEKYGKDNTMIFSHNIIEKNRQKQSLLESLNFI